MDKKKNSGDEDHVKLNIPVKQGWMGKKGRVRRNWKLRWFALYDNSLCYYDGENQDVSEAKGVISLSDGTIHEAETVGGKSLFTLHTQARKYYFYTTTVQDRMAWIAAIQQVLSKNAETGGDGKKGSKTAQRAFSKTAQRAFSTRSIVLKGVGGTEKIKDMTSADENNAFFWSREFLRKRLADPDLLLIDAREEGFAQKQYKLLSHNTLE